MDRSSERPSVLTSALGAYRELSPPVGIEAHFSRVWVHVVAAAGDECLPVVPDGCVDLQWIDGQLRVAGPDSQVNLERVPAGATVVGFRFQPGAAFHWLKVPLSELLDSRVPLSDIWGTAWSEPRIRFAAATGPAVAARLGQLLLAKSASIARPDRVASGIFRAVAASATSTSEVTRPLTQSLGISPRGLRRRCQTAFGYGAKSLHRILRFQAFLKLARARRSGSSITELAALAGYADHAHLCRDCAVMAGMTPTTVFARTCSPRA
jgi:AraC-like DNA-binding protein